MKFTNYTDALLSALTFNPKSTDVISRKQEVLNGVYRIENLEPQSILFVGFNPAILSCKAGAIAVTEISDTARKYLEDQNVKFTYIESSKLDLFRKKFQCVVAMDEYFTFAKTDQEQQDKIALLCGLATSFVISTIKDYKNQDYKDREFSQPISVKSGNNSKTFLEQNDWDSADRASWKSVVYEIDYPTNTMVSHGSFDRRTMYFKQLAKFSIDAGATNFLVHKNIMYKSNIKRNYEHVVSIQFN